MLVYAGIDEAGYGPMLGPLCVAATAFVIEDHDESAGAPDLWKILDAAVCRSRRDTRHRVAVDDSKKLKGASKSRSVHPLRHLERGVLSFRAAHHELPADDTELFADLGVRIEDPPWYDSSTPLPVGQAADEVRITGSRVLRAMAAAGIRCEMIECEAIDAGPFNDGVNRMGRKSTVNLCAAMRRVESVWSRWPDAHPRIIVDRQGGRTHYRQELADLFPEASIAIVAESEAVSRYTLDRGSSRLTLSFIRQAESGHLPTALASMTAKYVRELLMLRLNRFFIGHIPELKPTAGYVEDGRRYLQDIEPVIRRLGLKRTALVRAV